MTRIRDMVEHFKSIGSPPALAAELARIDCTLRDLGKAPSMVLCPGAVAPLSYSDMELGVWGCDFSCGDDTDFEEAATSMWWALHEIALKIEAVQVQSGHRYYPDLLELANIRLRHAVQSKEDSDVLEWAGDGEEDGARRWYLEGVGSSDVSRDALTLDEVLAERSRKA